MSTTKRTGAAPANVVYATESVLGVAGVGGPAAQIRRLLAERHAPSLVLARGAPDDAGADVRIVERSRWREALRGTRLHRLQARAQTDERIAFDRRVAATVPEARLVIGENTSSLETLRVARERGAATLLLQHNPELAFFRREVEIVRERFGGPPSVMCERALARASAELALADRVVVFSDFVATSLRTAGVADEKIARVRFGVDTERFRPRPRAQPGSKRDGPFTVAFVGWLSMYKGYPYLLAAFREANLPDSRLVLHGGSSLGFHHELVARLAGDSRVEIVRGDVTETYAQADAVVLPSVADGYGLVVLEAMACGVPVIVSRGAGAAEDVRDGETGFVIAAHDPATLRERLQRLHADHGLRTRMGEAARAEAEGHSWRRFGDDLDGVLQPLLRR